MGKIKIAALLFGVIFLGLWTVRAGFWQGEEKPATSLPNAKGVADTDLWMNIFQENRKIGYAHTRLEKYDPGCRLQDEIFMRLDIMGMAQDLKMENKAELDRDLRLISFNFGISSGRFVFQAKGRVRGKELIIETRSEGDERTYRIPLPQKPVLGSAVLLAVAKGDAKVGDVFQFPVFDPMSMKSDTARGEVLSMETIDIDGRTQPAKKVRLQYQEMSQTAWIGGDGSILRAKGALGLIMERTNRHGALFGMPIQASRDMTQVASVPCNKQLEKVSALSSLTLRIGGIDTARFPLSGGRQSLSQDGTLRIRKEGLNDLPEKLPDMRADPAITEFLRPAPFIQSDHPRIRTLAKDITASAETPVGKIRKLMAWMEANIDKRPVISMPDALATLTQGMGDCNEHAVLMAALCRATGIPARVEAGLVYLKGRFYYHAWNRVYIGRWITVDALFGQFPADVSHIRLAVGLDQLQKGILPAMDRIKMIEVVDDE